MQNAPETPQCRGILKQEILDVANEASEDPGVTFERNRRAHPHMIMMPPPLDCASSLWRAARRGGAPESPADADALRLRSYTPESLFMLGALTASVGTNVNPGNGVEGYQGETNISIDPNNPLHMVAHSNTFYKDPDPGCQSPTGGSANTYGTMALFGSIDGGATWTYKCAPWPASVTGGVSGATFWFGSDPALAWDNQGRAYATYMLISQSSTASGASIVTARSSDNGASWQSLGTVTSGITSTTIGNDKEMMAIDNTSGQAFSHPGRIFVIWDAANAEKIAYSDNGTTWTTVNFPSNTGAIGGNVVVGADGTVYVIWTRYNVETIVFSKSTDGGATWTTPAVIATLALQSFGTNNLPPAQDQRGVNGFGAIDIDRNPNSAFFGTLYVSFPDFPTGTTSGPDINTYVIRSTNGGGAWSTRVKVNDDNFGATQFFPWLAVDQSDGTVNVSWIDSRLDPLNRKTQAVYARSSDGGVSFEPNILVTDGGVNWRNNANYADENSTDNTSYNGNQYGDYTGIAAFNRQVHPLWTDSRSFFPVADTQSPTRREDNATSTIINCSAPAAIGAPSVNSSTTPSVTVSWSAPAGWGINATNGTYSVYRNTTSTFPGGSPLASGLTSTSYVDTTGVNSTTYFYFVRAKNNCPGTALTPMTTDSAASASVVYGSAGTATGVLQGTVTSGGNAVSGVVVSAGTFSATTNGSGFYQIPGINAGSYTVSASPAGYTPVSVNGVVVNGGATTVQDLSLNANASNNCLTDTSFGDFSTGSGTNADIAASPGDVKLTNTGGEAVDQNQGAATTISTTPTSTTWAGQTFTAGKTGNLTKITIGLGLGSGTTGTVTVEIHNASSNLPGSTVLSSVATLGPVTNGGNTVAPYTVTFSSPAAVVSGTQYSIVIKGVSNNVYVVRSSGNPYSGGQYSSTTTSGSSWTAASTADMVFTTYVTTPVVYLSSGNFVSSVKDSGAVTGATPNWTTLSWTNASLPGGTTLKFQVAASNSSSGPFNFVGPDGTASTFFTTSGASLSQFNGSRYLKYKALFTSTGSSTPTLNDVSVCFNNVTSVTTTLTAAAATGTFGGTVNLSATLTDGTNGISGKSIAFTLNGNSAGSATTDASGVATISNASLSGINAGSYPTGVGASFAGGGGFTASNSTAALTVNKADQTITFNALADKTYGDADFNVSATASSGLSVSFAASGNCTVTGTTVHLTGAGSCTITASQAGNSNYNAASDVPRSFTISKANQTITFGALADKTYGDADFSVSATASSGLTVSFAAAGNCTVTGTTVHITGVGSCTITASQGGDSNYHSAPNVDQSFNIGKANTTTTVTVSNASFDGNPHGGTASVTGPAGLNQSLTVNYAGRNATVYGPSTTAPIAAGDYTASANYAGDSNYNPSSDSKDYSIAKANQTITFGALGDKTYGDADFSVSATASSGFTVSFAASGNCTVTGSTVHITGGGSCTITASQGGDSNYNAAPNVDRSFNIAKANQTITFAALGDKTYGDADFSVSATASSGLIVSFAASGNCTVTGSTVHITGGGSCTITASQGGDSNYNAAPNVDRSFNIAKADQTITFGALADKTYGDADFSVSASASSGLTVSFAASGNCTVTGSTVHLTGAGSCTITASQAGDSGYNAATDVARSFNIAKATATVTLGNLSQTYDGTPKSASATTNPPGLNVTITYTLVPGAGRSPNVASNPTNAGSYTVQATIDDPNYEGSASDTLVIAKADATINVNGYSGVYDGNSHGATGTATGAQSEDLSSLLHLGASYTNVPGGTANWTFDGDTNYNTANGSVEIVISKATPTINWSNPANIIYGTALSGTQLNATGSVPGSFVYTPAAGTVLASGNGQNLHAAFTPTDTTNYNNATKDVAINVLTALLTTTMTVDRNPALVGYNHNYLISITNNGNAAATTMTLSDPLPSQVRFTAVTTSQGACSYNTGAHTVNCTLGTLGIGSTINLQITTKTLQTGSLDNTATVLASQWDPATGGNTASVNGLQAIAQVDLSVSKSDSPDPIYVSQNTTYTMVVKNYNTPISATGVVMTDSLPANMTFVSATTSQGSLVTPPVGSTGIVTANIGTLAVNATATITITVKANAAGSITNTATASANENEANPANNSASQTTTINNATLQKVLLASQVLTGGCQNTTGNVYLMGPAPTGGLTVNLASDISGASVPASVFIPAGSSVSPAFNVTTSPVSAKQVGLITATLGASTVSRGITINKGNGTCP
jgi:uncharacterized repeat protein (TIGR01451 family)